MNLIFDHVVELNPVPNTDSNTGIERFTSLTIVKDSLAIAINTGFLPEISNFFVGCTIEDRSRDLNAKFLTSITKLDFQNLTDVPTRRNTHRG